MNFNINQLPVVFRNGLAELRQDYEFDICGDIMITANSGEVGIQKISGGFCITYKKSCEFYREFIKLLYGEKNISERCSFTDMGVMIDCSRNAVLKVSAVKRYIRLLACMGYNTLMLYTEDTYEIGGEPFFGYMRGRYTKDELKEIDAYGQVFGVELVPCIQTLAHLNCITRWDRFRSIIDCNDILLASDERTYELIDKMFGAIAECFTSRRVHIGMDEAHMVGLGKYLDEHGYENRFDILLKHLNKVLEIAEKYGFSCTMWSDMFFRLANNGLYEPTNTAVPREVKKYIPRNLTLMYWDYHRNKQSEYEAMLSAHKGLTDNISFAGGIWRWNGFMPSNTMSINRTELALNACEKYGISGVLMTVWGDDGCECSAFSVLPTLVFAAEKAYSNHEYKQAFERISGVRYDDFNALELADDLLDNKSKFYGSNMSKVLLYNDLLSGIYDYAVRCEYAERLKNNAIKLRRKAKKCGKYKLLLNTAVALAELNAQKCDFGIRARTAYRNGDKAELKALSDKIPTFIKLLDKFYISLRLQWDDENKPFGFEIQDLRIGGLRQRMLHCRDKICDYVNGSANGIPELDEDILPAYPLNEEKEFRSYELWRNIVSTGVI